MADLTLGTDAERAVLLALCERAGVAQDHWHDRDSEMAQRQVGECWALLRAGCDFHIHGKDDDPKPDAKTIWLTTFSEGFNYFEVGERSSRVFYLPTSSRLHKADGKDWY